MAQVRYLGPAKEITFRRGPRDVTFTAGAPPVEVDDDFAAELVGKNPDGLDLEAAAVYCIPVFELVSGGGEA